MFLDACPADTLVLIDQPGISSEDFKLTPDTASLWTQFTRYFHRCGTLMPYMQTKSSLDFDKIANYFVRTCEAEVLKPDLARDNKENRFFDHYTDTCRRVIPVRFPPLPDDPEDRLDALFENDLMIHDIIKATPSPFFSIIYTNTQGANASVGPGLYSEYYLIDQLVKGSQDERNRDLWKKHAGPKEGDFLGDLGPVKPPLAVYQREQAASAQAGGSEIVASWVKRVTEDPRFAFTGHIVDGFEVLVEWLDSMLTVPRILLFVGISVMLGVLYAVASMVSAVFRPARPEPETTTATPVAPAKKEQSATGTDNSTQQLRQRKPTAST